jgi:hypothetical protein
VADEIAREGVNGEYIHSLEVPDSTFAAAREGKER